MIKAKVSTDYKDIERIFAGGAVQKEIIKVWSTEADAYVFETWKILEIEGPLPITFKANGEPLIDYRIYGNTEQTGTPTPENPIMPIGCGELETTGAHTGQYKLPILSNSTVTNIYLGEVETTRRIKKLVLTGEEGWQRTANEKCYYINSANGCPNDYLKQLTTTSICSHYQSQNNTASGSNQVEAGHFCFYIGGGFELYIGETTISSPTDFKSYLQQQYAAGTPVTVWYVLAEPETGIVNEPLMKIGDYADTVNMEQADMSIPTSKGTTTLDYDGEDHFITSDGYELVDKNQNGFLLSGSTLRPSKMYIKYKGR